jgi:hypothetical protein
MFTRTTLTIAAVVLTACSIGSALTRHSHGAANVISNVCFFGLVLLLAYLAAAALATVTRRRT